MRLTRVPTFDVVSRSTLIASRQTPGFGPGFLLRLAGRFWVDAIEKRAAPRWGYRPLSLPGSFVDLDRFDPSSSAAALAL